MTLRCGSLTYTELQREHPQRRLQFSVLTSDQKVCLLPGESAAIAGDTAVARLVTVPQLLDVQTAVLEHHKPVDNTGRMGSLTRVTNKPSLALVTAITRAELRQLVLAALRSSCTS